jgi:ferric-dicitrate binding protein FerR (iron transport regulator)
MVDDGEPLSERQVGAVIRRLADEHAARVAERDRARAWRRIESNLPQVAPVAGGGSRRIVAIAALVAAAAGSLLMLGSRADAPLSYELRGARAQGGIIEAQRGEATVSLSDGSAILAENHAKFSVDVLGKNTALTRLVSGKLHVRVVHNDDTQYRFIAGPYEVRVVGTEFDLAWDPSGEGLQLSMSKGEVQLAGPDGALHTLRAGQSLHLPAPALALARGLALHSAQTPAAPAAPAAQEEPETAGTVTRPLEHAARPSAKDSASWDALVAKGQFAEVVREAETLGIDRALTSKGPSDLKALGQAARYVGKRSISLRAFTALREQNRGEAARHAAFFLGRLYEEQGNQAEALRWLDTYVSEAPRGVYAAEAYGRRLTLTERLRGRAAALALGREYLERFPQGAYAQRARALVEARVQAP